MNYLNDKFGNVFEKISDKFGDLIDWVLYSDTPKITFLMSVLLGVPAFLIIWTTPMKNPVGYIESRGYHNAQIWGYEDRNCQRYYDGIVFYYILRVIMQCQLLNSLLSPKDSVEPLIIKMLL
jgi:hypothetical protein